MWKGYIEVNNLGEENEVDEIDVSTNTILIITLCYDRFLQKLAGNYLPWTFPRRKTEFENELMLLQKSSLKHFHPIIFSK